MAKTSVVRKRQEEYPLTLRASHVAEIMDVSTPTAYKYMAHPEFPKPSLPGSIARVDRDIFFEWWRGRHRQPS